MFVHRGMSPSEIEAMPISRFLWWVKNAAELIAEEERARE